MRHALLWFGWISVASSNHYAALGVNKRASSEEIKAAYRKKALECHPDKHGGDSVAFEKVNEAYEAVERSHQTRRRCDRWRLMGTASSNVASPCQAAMLGVDLIHVTVASPTFSRCAAAGFLRRAKRISPSTAATAVSSATAILRFAGRPRHGHQGELFPTRLAMVTPARRTC